MKSATSTIAKALSFGPADPELHPHVWRWILGLPLPPPAPARPACDPLPPDEEPGEEPGEQLEEQPAEDAPEPLVAIPDPVEPPPEEPSALEAPVPVPEVIPMEATTTPTTTPAPEEETAQETEVFRCTVPGCDGTRARVRHDTDPSIRSWCADCRVTVRQRALRQGLPVRVVAKRYLTERRGEPEAPATSKPADTPVRPQAVVPHHTPDGVLRVVTATMDVALPEDLVRLQEIAARAGGVERLDALVSAALALGGRP